MTAAAVFPERCVVDASVLIKLVLPEPGSDLARALLEIARLDTRSVPDLAYIECASILATSVRRQLQTAPEAHSGLRGLYASGLTVHPSTPLNRSALDLALR